MVSHTIELWNGKFLDYDHPSPDVMDIECIATHLAYQTRYYGAMKQYSIAEHSIKCARWAIADYQSPVVILGCLLHDAHEAFIGDISTPLKKWLGPAIEELRMLTNRLDGVLLEKFDLPLDLFTRDIVRGIDHAMLTVETWHGLPSMGEHIEWSHLQDVSDAEKTLLRPNFWLPDVAKSEFIRLFNVFYSRRHG